MVRSVNVMAPSTLVDGTLIAHRKSGHVRSSVPGWQEITRVERGGGVANPILR